MKLSEIQFADDAFKKVVLDTGVENAEDVVEIRGRKASIQEVKELALFPNLRLLDLTRNQITEIDVSQNELLEELYLGNNELEELDLSNNPKLTHLEIFVNDISELDLSNNAKLENLYADKCDLTDLDLSKNLGIEEIHVKDNELETLTLPKDCKPFFVKAANTKLDGATIDYLKSVVEAHNLKL